MEAEDAATGSEALERLRQAAVKRAPFDVALVDQQMPDMDGITLVRQIRRDAVLDSTRAVLVSPVGARLDSSELGLAGILAQITKPVARPALRQCLADVMNSDVMNGI